MNLLDITLEQTTAPVVKQSNHMIRLLANRVYEMLGQRVFFVKSEQSLTKVVKVDLHHLGRDFSIYVNQAMADAFLDQYHISLENMSKDALKLLLLSIEGQVVQIKDLSLVEAAPQGQIFRVISYDTSHELGWYVMFDMHDGFPMEAVMEAFSPYLKGVMTHPLNTLPITVPLVACTMALPAHELDDIEVGDVLLLESQ